MMRLTARQGRPVSLLVFVIVVAALILTAVGAARAATGTTSLPSSTLQTASFTVNARDVGDFADDPPAITSPSAIVVNMNTGKVLYEWDAYSQRPMASTTKIMTAVLILEKMNLSDEVEISGNAAATTEPKTWLKEGDVLTVEQLLYALMVRSANSAAVALAEACSGSVEEFVVEMNRKAAELGMHDTNFVNPNGLDTEGHYSTAADMALLARYAMKNDMFRQLVSTETYTISLPGRDEPLVFTNTNKLLGAVDYVTGIKTGLTPKAEQCLVASGTLDGVSVVSVLLGQPASDVCWTESETLLEYGLRQYRYVTLVKEGTVVAAAEVPYHLDGQVQLVNEHTVDMELYKDDSVTVSVTLDRELILPVMEGEVFGRVDLTVGGEVVETVDIVALQSYDETTLGAKIVYFLDRLGRWLGV